MRKLILTLFLIFFGLIIINLCLLLTGQSNFERGETRFIVFPLFYTYSWIAILICLPVLAILLIYRLLTNGTNPKSCGLLLLFVGGVILGACSSLGLLGRTVLIDHVTFHGDQYYLVKQPYYDIDIDYTGWGKFLCRIKKGSLLAECSYLTERDYDNGLLEYQGLATNDGLQIVTKQGVYSIIDTCVTPLEDDDYRPFCPYYVIMD
jgi:hypothetical protein